MRNLKRALSLALASVMLLGMMVVGTSAASINDFTDVDEINNKEAVAIATGLGIFDGYTDGSFGPEKAVTRAEAAVVIAKILHGSDVNPANLAGAGKFTDVPAWAEGYVNLVAALKIIEGRGEGIFDPSATVTTVEYTTMLLKALGYYVDVETALDADWKLEVTSKANALGLYGDLELGMNAPLSREDVASLTFNALFAQRVAYNDYRGQYVKATDRDVVVTNGTVDEMNTLAQNTFGLYSVEGIVTANGATDATLMAGDQHPAQTTVVFTGETDLNKDGKFEYAADEEYDFEVESGLDMIGHAAKVYYKLVKKAPVVYAIVDQATKVEVITSSLADDTALNTTSRTEGFKRGTASNAEFYANYVDQDVLVKNARFSNADGQALILISNSADESVDVVIQLTQTLDKVDTINTAHDAYTFVNGNVLYNDEFAVTGADLAEGDYVVVTAIDNDKDTVADFYNMYAAEVVPAEVTKITRKTATNVVVTADGVDYDNSAITEALADVTHVLDVINLEETGIILDENGLMVGVTEEIDESVPYAYVAQWGAKDDVKKLTDPKTLAAHIYFADGTNAIHFVKASNVSAITTALSDPANATTGYTALNTEDYITLYSVSIDANGYATINAVDTVNAGAGDGEAGITTASDNVTQIKTGLSYVGSRSGQNILANNKTVFFYKNGTYGTDLTVEILTGIKNAVKVTDASKIEAAYLKHNTTYYTLTTALIEGVPTNTLNAYYYNGKYTITYNETDKYIVTYQVWKDGEETTLTYPGFASEAKAKTSGDSVVAGYVVDGSSKPAPAISGTTIFVDPSAIASVVFNPYVENIFTANDGTGVIVENAKIVDLTGNKIDDLASLTTAIKNIVDFGGKKYTAVNVAYTYNNETYAVDTMYVTRVVKTQDAAADGSVAFGISNIELANSAGKAKVVFDHTGTIPAGTKVAAKVYKDDGMFGTGLVGTFEWIFPVDGGPINNRSVTTNLAVTTGEKYFVEFTVAGTLYTSETFVMPAP